MTEPHKSECTCPGCDIERMVGPMAEMAERTQGEKNAELDSLREERARLQEELVDCALRCNRLEDRIRGLIHDGRQP